MSLRDFSLIKVCFPLGYCLFQISFNYADDPSLAVFQVCGEFIKGMKGQNLAVSLLDTRKLFFLPRFYNLQCFCNLAP